jgi:hypothetical protein
MAQEQVVFISKSPSCIVSFEEIRKEDKHGPATWGLEKFISNTLKIHPADYYGVKRGKGIDIIRRLRSHKLNKANGGSEFWELSKESKDSMELAEGKIVARSPEIGITSEVSKRLVKLHGYISNYPKENNIKIVEELRDLFEIFSVKGLQKPEESFDSTRVWSRLIEFFSVLKERNIWDIDKA